MSHEHEGHDHNHDHEGHDHNHEEKEFITLVDDEGNESLYEILLTVDGQEEFQKNYVLVYPAGIDEDDDTEIELQAYAYTENDDGTEGELEEIETDAEWDMIEEVFNTFMADEDEE
ncbi:DUF1292 domain-containing protein [Enterococcus timonensis]|uniref:DUF1292 domain-containing protein n=1 Tax=Enterococcus timonensis TaxID=1852364 RepID=UPI0008D9C6AE|nr:DUF1292 domain-containing protein [Enterococcus timonensis]